MLTLPLEAASPLLLQPLLPLLGDTVSFKQEGESCFLQLHCPPGLATVVQHLRNRRGGSTRIDLLAVLKPFVMVLAGAGLSHLIPWISTRIPVRCLDDRLQSRPQPSLRQRFRNSLMGI
ncbi:hypothetical protein GE09DRAFT_68230 [Coniochaeta sp. 2T2.1]|nr:hypothetical protein GE09DRAFT_68230 [Coniochaeta sp. 2T2.1]